MKVITTVAEASRVSGKTEGQVRYFCKLRNMKCGLNGYRFTERRIEQLKIWQPRKMKPRNAIKKIVEETPGWLSPIYPLLKGSDDSGLNTTEPQQSVDKRKNGVIENLKDIVRALLSGSGII